MLLKKDQILAADDLPFRDIDVPEWGGSVRVRTMTGRERDAWESLIYVTTGKDVQFKKDDFRAKLLAKTIVDENGSLLFTEAEIAALSGKSSKVISRLFDAAQDLNGISKEVQENIEKK